MHDARFVVAGYLLTALALGGYVTLLLARVRRAKARASVIVARRDAPDR